MSNLLEWLLGIFIAGIIFMIFMAVMAFVATYITIWAAGVLYLVALFGAIALLVKMKG